MEALTRVHVCIREKQDKIQEKDYDVLKALHGLWFKGEVPFYQTITYESKSSSATQTGLFDDRKADDIAITTENPVELPNGTNIELSSPLTKKEKKR